MSDPALGAMANSEAVANAGAVANAEAVAKRGTDGDPSAAEPVASESAALDLDVRAEPAVALVEQSSPWAIGAAVCLQGIPPYLKTADPMPMLRPPDLVDVGEVGVVVGLRARDQLAVRFRRGTFLLVADQLEEPAQEPGQGPGAG